MQLLGVYVCECHIHTDTSQSYSRVCENHTLRVKITLVCVEITLVCVEITLVRVVITFVAVEITLLVEITLCV
jgi:hypothetical protein